MMEIVTIAKLYGDGVEDRALHRASKADRFAPRNVASILANVAGGPAGESALALAATDVHSLQPGTGAWEVLR